MRLPALRLVLAGDPEAAGHDVSIRSLDKSRFARTSTDTDTDTDLGRLVLAEVATG